MPRRSACLLAITATVLGLATVPARAAVAAAPARAAVAAAPAQQQVHRATAHQPWRAVAQGVRARALSGHRVELSWTAPRESGYAGLIIRRSAGAVAPTAGTGVAIARVDARSRGYLDSAVLPGRRYSYALFARNAAGRLGPAARASVAVPAARTRQQVSTARPNSADLSSDGAISGKVTAVSGSPLENANANVYDENGQWVAGASTGPTGTYRVDGVQPGTYYVCTDGSAATGGSASYGYLSLCWKTAPYDGYEVGGGSTPVPVVAGSVHSGVNFRLRAAGAISGTVTETGGGTLENYDVSIFDAQGNQVFANVSEQADGTYQANGLTPASGYVVCFNGQFANGGTSAGGYLPQCYAGVAWDYSGTPAPDATPVSVTAGVDTTGIDAALDVGAAVGGTVTSSATGQGIRDVFVEVMTPAGDYVYGTSTAPDGSYAITGLSAAQDYILCFEASGAHGGGSTTGYLSECYDNVPWDGSSQPTGATAVTLAAGGVTAADAALGSASAISGRVTAASGGAGLANVDAFVFDAAGNTVADVQTSATGSYRVSGLAPTDAGYVVCFDGSNATGGTSLGGYRSQCYQNQPWNGSDLPESATPVPVSAGSVHGSVNAKLAAGGAISGVVTADDAAVALEDVDVQVFKANGDYVSGTFTGPDGSYRVAGLAPSTSYRVCFRGSYVTDGPSTAGYLDECYDDVPWTTGSPSTGAAVSVGAAAETSGIDASLADAAGVRGRVVSDATGAGIADVEVVAYDASDNFVGFAFTSGSGNYLLTGLPENASGYSVCFLTSSTHGGGVATGYVPECYDNVPWDGYSDPTSTATPVPATAGTVSSGIDAALGSAGGIAGKVTAVSDGAALAGVDVVVTTPDGVYLEDTATGADGTYRFIAIPPSTTGYVVCFDATDATGGTSTTGYISQCYNNQPWIPGSETPSAATQVSVASGRVHGGISARLRSGAAITGTVTAASDGSPVGGVYAIVFNGSDYVTAETTSEVDGTYRITGLSAGTYDVCFDAVEADSAPSLGYADQCWHDADWDGRYGAAPAGAHAVVLHAGTAVTGVDAALTAAGAISGHVTTAAGTPPADGYVEVFGANGFLNGSQTDASGNYRLTGLNPATGPYTVCFRDEGDRSGPPTGYAPQCYQGVPWNGSPAVPAGSTGVSVAPGATTSTIDAVLTTGGAISGKVTDFTTGDPVPGVYPMVFDTAGHRIADSITGAAGTYRVNSLAPGQYVVCFAVDGPHYVAQCWNNVAWDNSPQDIPSGATVITVSAAGVRNNINARLVPPAV